MYIQMYIHIQIEVGQQEKQHMHFPSTYITVLFPSGMHCGRGRGKHFFQKLNATIESQNRVKECNEREREPQEKVI